MRNMNELEEVKGIMMLYSSYKINLCNYANQSRRVDTENILNIMI